MSPQPSPPINPQDLRDCDQILARYGELWLKGHNRDRFVHTLQKRVRTRLRQIGLHGVQVNAQRGNLHIVHGDPAELAQIAEVLTDTPGVSRVQPSLGSTHDLDQLRADALRLCASSWHRPGAFAVRARRSNKSAPLRSENVARELGSALAVATGRPVNLRDPEVCLWVDITQHGVTLWTTELAGPGGLPVGSSGQAMLLLSGGFDSPVAGFRVQRRGCELEAIHFHAPPLVTNASLEKVRQLSGLLARRQGRLPLHVVPFTQIQLGLRDNAPDRLRVMLARRMMYRIADALAELRGIEALAGGESVGQVASQTLSHLSAVDAVIQRVTLRPLIGFDKQEILDEAHSYGSYEISNLPANDACTLLAPASPATRTHSSQLDKVEADLPIEAWLREALAGVETEFIEPPAR